MLKKTYVKRDIFLTCGNCGVALNAGATECDQPGCTNKRKVYEYDRVTDVPYARLAAIKARAQRKNLTCDLTYEQVALLISQPCHYCEATGPSQIDRKDCEVGYTILNVVAACRRCNTVKNEYVTHKQMHEIVNLLGWMQP